MTIFQPSRFLKMTAFLPALFLLAAFSGCALFSGHKGAPAQDKDAEKEMFETQRSDQESMSDFVASAGRANPKEKKKADKGQTFLLSSKAQEIYNNTER